ncbi:MAG: hypothetical protein NT091_03960 [Candidatus Falkowbacteria bacterium]|nr:hypothetical protein [Candidatus Falkowbacteria bacterium]
METIEFIENCLAARLVFNFVFISLFAVIVGMLLKEMVIDIFGFSLNDLGLGLYKIFALLSVSMGALWLLITGFNWPVAISIACSIATVPFFIKIGICLRMSR